MKNDEIIEVAKSQQADLQKVLELLKEQQAIISQQAEIIKGYEDREKVLMERINSEPERYKQNSSELLKNFSAAMHKAQLLMFTHDQHYKVLKYIFDHWEENKTSAQIAAKLGYDSKRAIENILQELRKITQSETNEQAIEKYDELGMISPETRFQPPF